MCVCVCVGLVVGVGVGVGACVRTCACTRACVLCLSTVKASSVCSDVLDTLEYTDQQSCAVCIILGTFAKFLNLSF